VWDVKLSVGDQNLYHERSTGSRIIDHSRYVNKRLRKAGVEKIEIEQGTTAEDIELILNTLSNRGLNKAKEILEARSVIFHPQLFPES
jgi:copper oxidase (laccase) domain-containing protein